MFGALALYLFVRGLFIVASVYILASETSNISDWARSWWERLISKHWVRFEFCNRSVENTVDL